MTRACGTCSLCCKVMAVPALGKPRNTWCQHARPGRGGCAIQGQPERPVECGEFMCAWLERPDVLPDDLRPDRVHAFITGAKAGAPGQAMGDAIVVHVDPGYPDAWRTGPLAGLIERVTRAGLRVLVAVGNKRYMRMGARSGWHAVAAQDIKEVAP
jgi:hypothetical protein